MAKLMDDFLSKKKETSPILDLSRSVANTQDEFKRLMERIPDFKIKAEKVPPESIKIREKKFKFKAAKKDLKVAKEPFAFMDPLPKEMRDVKVGELAKVNIDWRMLTTVRPKAKLEENFFTKLVDLKKLENKANEVEKRRLAYDPPVRKIKNKSGVVEMRVVNCKECGDDFCNGRACVKMTYDSFVRIPELSLVQPEKLLPEKKSDKSKKTKTKRKSRPRLKSKSQRKPKTTKSKSPSAKPAKKKTSHTVKKTRA